MYYDPVAEATSVWEQRQRCRQRTESALRGWLRDQSAPRSLALLFLVAGGLPGLTLGLALYRHTGSLLVSVPAGVSVLWVVFLGLVRWRAETEIDRIDFRETGRDRFVFSDERVQQLGTSPLSPAQQEAISRGLENSLECRQQNPAAEVLVLLLLGSLTLGLWILWQLVHMGADLLAQSVLDGPAAQRNPRLFERITLEPWLRRVVGMTLLHFVTLAAAIIIFLSSWSVLEQFRREAEWQKSAKVQQAI